MDANLVLMGRSLVLSMAFVEPHLGAVLSTVHCDIPAHIVVGNVPKKLQHVLMMKDGMAEQARHYQVYTHLIV